MRVKTSVTLSQEAITLVDRMAKGGSNRSRVIEEAIRALAASVAKVERDRRDIEAINRNADRLNAEAEDALGYQARW